MVVGEANLQEVPVARSKLHGHRGVKSYDPRYVEHVFLNEPYYQYPVSCSTEAQARAIKVAFSRSEALLKPDDPRQVVFTVLPGHGIVIVEKWVTGKNPFQIIWEYMDKGYLQIDNLVPQGALTFTPREFWFDVYSVLTGFCIFNVLGRFQKEKSVCIDLVRFS